MEKSTDPKWTEIVRTITPGYVDTVKRNTAVSPCVIRERDDYLQWTVDRGDNHSVVEKDHQALPLKLGYTQQNKAQQALVST